MENQLLTEEEVNKFLEDINFCRWTTCPVNVGRRASQNVWASSHNDLIVFAGLYDRDLSYNFFNGSIPESLGQLTSLRRLNLNSNSLSGRVPAMLGGRLLHRASFNFTDNAGLCGIPGLRTCGPHLSVGAKIGIALGSCVAFLLIVTCLMCWWKRRQNILRAQRIAAREAPYAKARTHFSRDVQMTRHYGPEHAKTATENGPSLLS